MKKPNEHNLTILGRKMTILSEEDPERIVQMERLLNERLQAMGASRGLPLQSALTLAALSLAGDVLDERQHRFKLKEKIRSRSAELLEKLDALQFAA